MRWLRFVTMSIVIIGTLNLPACQSRGPGKARVGFVSNNPHPFWTIAEAGCRKAEAEFAVEVVFKKPEAGEVAKQKEIIDNLVNQNLGAIAVSVIDPKNQRAYLDTVAAKIPLIAVDNDAPGSNRICYIGTDNYSAGRATGKLVKEAMPSGGTLAIFVGQLEALNARQRRQGVLDELADRPTPTDISNITLTPDGEQYGKFKLFRTFTDQPEGETKAKQNANDALIQLKDVPNVVMVGLWAYNPPAILSAAKELNRLDQIKIVAFDEAPETLRGIADGHIHATVVQDPYGFGYESVKQMAALVKGDKSGLPAGGIQFVPHRIITKTGGEGRMPVADFSAELEQRLGKR